MTISDLATPSERAREIVIDVLERIDHVQTEGIDPGATAPLDPSTPEAFAEP